MPTTSYSPFDFWKTLPKGPKPCSTNDQVEWKWSTDPNKWKLEVDHGRQVWVYNEDETQQSTVDKYWLGTLSDAPTLPSPKTPLDFAENGYRFYELTQTEDGHFAGEYGGPMFLIGGLVITHYITDTPLPAGYKDEIIRYLRNRANKVDGGWGLHIEGHSTCFGTALNYVALRLLGVPADDPTCRKAREFLHSIGGAVGIPAWGKFWLSVLGAYEWDGNQPIPPEPWLLPNILPLQPGNWWCHCRLVYLPMSWLWAKRFVAPLTPLVRELRKELYVQDYEKIQWELHRGNVAKVDLYTPTSKVMDFANSILNFYEKYIGFGPIRWLRNKAMDEAWLQIKMEDENTKFLDIGPVNKVMNMLVVWIQLGPDSKEFKQHVERNKDFMWISREGMMMNGTNGSQLWDTAFICQSLYEAGLIPKFLSSMQKALDWLDDTQIKNNPKHHHPAHRYESKGAWPFSTRDQSYTVSDCTAEGMKTVLLLQSLPQLQSKIPKERLYDAVNVLLGMQNKDGGFASYEPRRGPKELELLNPAQVFGNIMVDYSYVECTTAVVLGLSTFKKFHPSHRRQEIDDCISKALDYVKKDQRSDGSWYGSWAICFTYATWFGIESLASQGLNYENSDEIRRACDFLISKQRQDGGWGESYSSCETHEYQDMESQVVNTSWAVMALMAGNYPHQTPIRRGIQLIAKRQLPTGEWLQEAIEGVFNHNCMISYPNYKFAFTIWALGRFANKYGNEVLEI